MRYGLIGEKLSHSFSTIIHKLLNNNDYILKELDRNELDSFFNEKKFFGINVTIPYKEEVIKYLDYIDEKAKEIAAINTIKNVDGKLYGFNTDYYGLRLLLDKYNIDVKNKKVLILGTGGTSKTCEILLNDLKATSVIKASRNKDNKNDKEENIFTYEEILKNHNDINVIINTTPVGMYSNTDLDRINNTPIDINKFDKLEAVVDIIYNPLNTRLIIEARKRSIKYSNGLYMLVAQAIYADKIFFDNSINEDLYHYVLNNIDTNEIKNNCDEIYNIVLNDIQNIVFIGMPGSGKTVVGKELSKILNKKLVDTDVLFSEKYGLFAGEYINEYGEESFREKESIIIEEISKENNLIISTGGGAILREENIDNLRLNGIFIFIDRKIENLKISDSRPLTNSEEKLKRVYAARLPLYNKYADFTIKSDEVIENTVKKIIEYLDV